MCGRLPLGTFSARPSSPAARRASFLSIDPTPADAAAVATEEAAEETLDAPGKDEITLYGTETGISYDTMR
jgi:hypothetical protein